MLRKGLLAAGMAGVILVMGAVGQTGGSSYAERLKQVLEPIDSCLLAAAMKPYDPRGRLTCWSDRPDAIGTSR